MFPKPHKAVLGVMIAVFAIWLLSAVFMGWLHVGEEVFAWFVGTPDAVLHGEVWRLVTAAFMHVPGEPWHMLTTILGVYFLGNSLEDRWGAGRMLGFLVGSAAFAFAVQIAVGLVIPSIAAPLFLGGLGMVEAVAVAWALQNRNRTVNLFMVLPVSGTMLLVFVIGMSVLNLIARRAQPEGLITPIAALGAGYLFGDTSFLRRYYLKLKLRRIQAQTSSMTKKRRAAAAGFSVIQGGADEPPKDKRYLN